MRCRLPIARGTEDALNGGGNLMTAATHLGTASCRACDGIPSAPASAAITDDGRDPVHDPQHRPRGDGARTPGGLLQPRLDPSGRTVTNGPG